MAIAATPWTRRGSRFWIGAAPILGSYALLLLRVSEENRPAALAAHHELQAPQALRLVQDLAGGYVKMGQVLANRADLLPEPYVRAFGTLHDCVPPRPWRVLARRLPIDAPALTAALESVDPTPLGAASTGQAHTALLRNGSRVVLKLQYPEARSRFGADFANVARLTRLSRLAVLTPVVIEVRRRFRLEFDYAREAADMAEIGDRLRASRCRAARRVVIPRPLISLTTPKVLVMEKLPGPTLLSSTRAKIIEALGEPGYLYLRADAQGVAPPPGARPPSRARMLLHAPGMWRLRRRTQRRIALLSSVLGSQILSHGVFHADPHPGNVLLLPDGRLGLIDFGQVVRLRKERQLALARLIVALADAPAPATPGATSAAGAAASLVGNDAVAEAARELGFETSRNSNEGLTALSSFFFDRDPPPVGGRGGRRRSPSQTLLALNQYDALRTIPSDIILAARVSLLLRGTAQLAASSPLSIARLWKGEAKRAIRSGRGY